MSGRRYTIYIPDEVWEQVEAAREEMNVSRVCVEALKAELERMKTPRPERKWLARLWQVREAQM